MQERVAKASWHHQKLFLHLGDALDLYRQLLEWCTTGDAHGRHWEAGGDLPNGWNG